MTNSFDAYIRNIKSVHENRDEHCQTPGAIAAHQEKARKELDLANGEFDELLRMLRTLEPRGAKASTVQPLRANPSGAPPAFPPPQSLRNWDAESA